MKKTITLLTVSVFTFCNAVAQQPINIQVKQSSYTKLEKAQPISEETTSPKRKCATPQLNESFENWIQKEIQKQEQFFSYLELRSLILFFSDMIYPYLFEGVLIDI